MTFRTFEKAMSLVGTELTFNELKLIHKILIFILDHKVVFIVILGLF
jgi:hypothetical protein